MAFTLLTGGSSGIGAATCRLLLDAGHQVISLDRKPGALQSPQLQEIQVDLTDPEATQSAAQQIASRLPVTTVIHNAGAVRVDVVCARQRRHIDDPVAEASGNGVDCVADAWIGARDQPVDRIGDDTAAQAGEVVRGGDAVAIIDPQADDRCAGLRRTAEHLHIVIGTDPGDCHGLAIRPGLADPNGDAVTENDAIEQAVQAGARVATGW